jgi:hypothetical protein
VLVAAPAEVEDDVGVPVLTGLGVRVGEGVVRGTERDEALPDD